MTTYTQTYSYAGESFTVTIQMRTGTSKGDVEVPVNTITINHFDGTTSTIEQITDDNILPTINQFYSSEISAIDGVPNPELDMALLQNGFTRS